MPQKIFRLCLTLALSCCLLAPALHADEDGADVWSEEDMAALRARAEAGDADARFDLGEMYFNGRGVPQDDREAAAWYRKAAEQGHTRAQCPSELRGILRNSEEGMGEQGEASEPASSGEGDAQAWRPGAPVNPDALAVSPEALEAYYEALVRSPAFEAWVESMQGNDAAPASDGKAAAPDQPGKGQGR